MMSSPPTSSNNVSNSGTRRSRYSRSPSTGGAVPPSKRSKPSSSADAGSSSEQHRLYTSICVKNINPKIPDLEVRELCDKKFSKYGEHSVKIYYKNQERVAFVNFTNCEDARKARHAKTGLVWENIQVALEPVYYRRTVPAEQPISANSPRDRSPSPRRRPRRPSPSPPPPPPPPSRSRHHHTSSPPRSRRHYSPYIPLPPDLAEYATKKSSGTRRGSSPSPVRERTRRSRSSSGSPRQQKSRSKYDDSGLGRTESNVQHEPTRTLFVGNLERDIRESKLREVFGRYGTIDEIDLKVPQSSSKRAYAFIQYENMDMAYEARQAMDGHFLGKADCKIGYGKIVPTCCLWIGNISMDVKQRDLKEAFSRYGTIKSFDYSTGDPTAVITYNEIEDAIKARAKMTGVKQIVDGKKIRAESGQSDSSRRDGFRIDYLDRPTARRFVIVRPQDNNNNNKSRKSRSSSRSSSSSDRQENNEKKKELKQVSSASRSPSTERRSLSPAAPGRTFFDPYGSYLSTKDTKNVHNINDLIDLCEKIHSMYSVQFILKSHGYPARMHFLAGNPQLARKVLSKSKELKLTQRLHLDQSKFDETEEKIEKNVKKSSSAHQTNFSLLISSVQSNGDQSKDDESSLSRFISYLTSKEAAGVISVGFQSNEENSNEKEETATLNIFPPCQLSKKILQTICPSINFSNGPQTPPSRSASNITNEHLMVLIFHN